MSPSENRATRNKTAENKGMSPMSLAHAGNSKKAYLLFINSLNSHSRVRASDIGDKATERTPVAGTAFQYDGRSYEVLSSAPQAPPRIALQSMCVNCGRRFQFSLPADWHARGFQLNRFCLTCLPERQGKIRAWRADDCRSAARGARR
jgi:hypothetical protein